MGIGSGGCEPAVLPLLPELGIPGLQITHGFTWFHRGLLSAAIPSLNQESILSLLEGKLSPSPRSSSVWRGGGVRLKIRHYPAKFSIVRDRFFAMIHVPCRGKLPAAGDERPSISCPCGREPAITTSNHNPVFRGMLRKIPGF